MSSSLSAVLVLLTLISITLQAAGQPEASAHQSRHGNRPYPSAGVDRYPVWIGMDLSGYWNPRSGSAHFTSPRWNDDADIAGGWITDTLPGLILTLEPDGRFSLATAAEPDRRCASGVERGSWAVMKETGQLYFRIKTDTNGPCGLSDTQAPMTVSRTNTGMLTLAGGANAGRELPLVRR